MFYYFGYGSNLSVISLRAKGVAPLRSEPAILEGWRLAFNVPDFFWIEGATGNIEPREDDAVHGVLHACRDGDLAALDRLEALGFTYKRIETSVTTYTGRRKLAYVYVGLTPVDDDRCLPSERYRNILVRGGVDMKLDASYVERLRRVRTLAPPRYGSFAPIAAAASREFTLESLSRELGYTALSGCVFDMEDARPEHAYLKRLLGGKDVTLLFLKRMDTSDGKESFDDVRHGRLGEHQKRYLNSYLHEFAREYRLVGRIDYEDDTPGVAYTMVGAPDTLRRPGSRRPSAIIARKNYDVPSRAILEKAQTRNEELGHENLGFLSEDYGFMPREPPRKRLPPAFAAWDQLAGSLPDLYRSLRLRRELYRLPVLDASEASLPDDCLLRAAAVLAMLSHAHYYVETNPPERQPEGLSTPWRVVRERLDRGPAALSYIDLIVYNWTLLDHTRADPMRIENMRLLIPTVDTDEERIFYLTQTEILARCSPILGAVVRAQEAVVADDAESLENELLTITSSLERVVRDSLLNINPNPSSATYVDPVVWAKTVAPFAVPMQNGLQGPSGTSSPIFNTLDIFFGRKNYQTFLGKEIHQLRNTYPVFWREMLVALGQVSVPEYVAQSGNNNLEGLLQEAMATYAGPSGFLGRHRMKVYGYLELAFKVGRNVTIGGFKGVFKDRTWDLVDSELEQSRVERTQSFPQSCHHVSVVSVTPPDGSAPDEVSQVKLDISGTGIRYEPGDRCGVLAENQAELIDRTLSVLGATGDETVKLTHEWREAIRLRAGYSQGAQTLTLREVLLFGQIRPVLPRVAEALHAITQDESLREQMALQTTRRFELWDLLTMLARSGFDPASLWRTADGEPSEALCRVVPPETFRMYSIASTMVTADMSAQQELSLTVRRLRYESEGDDQGGVISRYGTASSFLAGAAGRTEPISVIIQHPPRFGLPRSAKTPIIMLAGGTGLSPFRGFIAERQQQPAAGEALLFFGLRSRDHFTYGEELAPAIRAGTLKLRLAFSRDDVDMTFEAHRGAFVELPGQRRQVQDILLEEETARTLWQLVKHPDQGGSGAYVYICGRSDFARSMLEALTAVFRRFSRGTETERDVLAEDMLCELMAEGRLLQEIFSGHADNDLPHLDVSQIARRNDRDHGYWLVIDGRVYDVTKFVRLHPGGSRILKSYAGMDATEAYARSHGQRSEIDAMREIYAIGRLRTLRLDRSTVSVDGPTGPHLVSITAAHRVWVKLLYLVVEMQNALANDHALQTGVTARGDPVEPRSPYKLQRAVETHERFLRSYLDLLIDDSLPNLWAVTQGLFASGADLQRMRMRLSEVQVSHAARFTEGMIAELFNEVKAFVERGEIEDERTMLVEACQVIESEDRRLLADIKDLLIAGVAVFEELGMETHPRGGLRLVAACRALPERIQRFHGQLMANLRDAGWKPALSERPRSSEPKPRTQTVLLVSRPHWVMEEDQLDRVVVMRRTPLDFSSMKEIVDENDKLIAQIRPEHSKYGAIIDMRQAPPRNDPEYENGMQRLRARVTSQFARVAVLLDTPVAVLQADRLKRAEGQKMLATLSEGSARRFARGSTEMS